MKLKQLMAGATIAAASGVAALGVGAGAASAAPGPGPGGGHGAPPAVSGPAHQDPGGGGHGPGGPGDQGPGGPWHSDDQRGYFHGAPWGDGPAPWGAGAPPRPNWDRPLPPPGGYWNEGPINYYGYNENPVWNPGFSQWGFDFFGFWIPL